MEFMVRGMSFALLKRKLKSSSSWLCSTTYAIVFSVKMSTSSFLSSIMLLLHTDEILCLAVSIVLGLDKGSCLPKLIEASLLKCLSFSFGPTGSTKTFAASFSSALFEHGHTVASFFLRHSIGSVTQRSRVTFVAQNRRFLFHLKNKQNNNNKGLCICLYCIAIQLWRSCTANISSDAASALLAEVCCHAGKVLEGMPLCCWK